MFNLNSLFDLDSLPVAPEFAEVLAENATATAIASLEALRAPENLISLVRNIHELGYYLAECYRSPNAFLRDRNDRFDVEGVVIETVNLIALARGVFHGPEGDTNPREAPTPIQIGGPQ